MPRRSERSAQALEELARKVATVSHTGSAHPLEESASTPTRPAQTTRRERPSPRVDRSVRRKLHDLLRRWWQRPETSNPVRPQAGWAAVALEVPIESDEWEGLQRSRDQRFRDCAERAGVR